ncbi:polysaccharide pyruvyl transferase family protein [Phosphitispora fastidiosa]|uniref:polysaccharide pyruvyl transferase family protein n=1 Tax=Phosphitispora fastidiosa TaxID=2837202 RepID=UPI001E53B62A|nr:polysaccharide pyruvyl transferase family protein [Phosphitispora fastidiosa]MBU7008189.1 hypothetical protein [Phosphitispora fastidiosa]
MNKKLKILCHGSCWPTNIGNAFVQLGMMNYLKRALGEKAEVYHYGSLSTFLFWKNGYPQNDLNISNISKFDYIIIGGMTQCVDYYKSVQLILKNFVKIGTKIIISGGGGQDYNQKEIEEVRGLMKQIPIYAFISRDTYSFEEYGDLAEKSFDGIDSAFFVGDNFIPIPLDISDFNVINFDSLEEPVIFNTSNNEDQGAPRKMGLKKYTFDLLKTILKKNYELAVPSRLDMEGRKVIRTHHAAWPTEINENMYKGMNTLISDIPTDYLTLYSQVHTVYSDRVHACVAALAFGNRAMLFGKENPRIRMFERIGAGGILKGPVQVDMNSLEENKTHQVNFLKEIFTEEY